MFDRFIRLARARRALHEGRYEEAAELAADPLIAGDRRAEEVRRTAQAALAQRGRDRLRGGDAAAAVRDLQRAVAVGPHSAAAADLSAARHGIESDAERHKAGQRQLDEARRLAERGQLAAAAAALADAATDPKHAAIASTLHGFVAARRHQAEHHRQQAAARLEAGQIEAAVDAVRAARALDDGCVEAGWLRTLLGAAAASLADAMERHLAVPDERAALRLYRQRTLALPELVGERRVRAEAERLATALHRRLSAAASEDDLELVQACAEEPALPGDGPRVLAGAQAMLRLPGLRTGGRVGELTAALAAATANLDNPALAAEQKRLRTSVTAAAGQVEAARALAAGGDLQAARKTLAAVLQELPMHEEARSELDAIDAGAREREQRLEAARQAAKAGKLREAYALALAHAQGGPAGAEARLFAQDLQARMELVNRGLDQVRAALHGRTSGASAGLRHCMLRVEELAKVQIDHEEIPALCRALAAELEGIETAEAAAAAAARGQFGAVAEAVATLVQQRGALLLPDRLDARILELADQLGTAAETALAAGRLVEVERCAQGLAAAAPVRPHCRDLADRLRTDARDRQQRAEALAEEARQLLAARDLSAAEQRCEAARQLWVDGSLVRKVEDELQSLRQQEAALLRVEALAKGGDVAAAHAELGDLPPTPPLLRTRIFDMKRSLARAQGLDGAFLLRVDEGGEFVVLRGDTVTIGNLRDGRADLPVLAAIAGRHARLQRSMSFHGGMEDSIVAEGGELRHAGRRLDRHRLRDGDRVHLGAALQLAYEVPSKRSLTAGLRLLGGFQVAGTDRVLLFKDRGRDGRILFGPGKDVHVPVHGATGEVELFANKAGQMRVRCDAGGEIDGRPFRGEHPVAAGATVRAAGISFVALPWVRGG